MFWTCHGLGWQWSGHELYCPWTSLAMARSGYDRARHALFFLWLVLTTVLSGHVLDLPLAGLAMIHSGY